ncbi:cytochrome-c oxidase, cbb3-type subunit III [bacterium]|nr:cytochrome-c oxidase, cbb3-type subunit III [bacterium]
MTDRSPEVDDHSGTETTGHEWDGIKELNTPLPRWWRFIFWGTVIWSVVYWILMPAWPGLPGMSGYTPGVRGHSDRANVAADLSAAQASRAEFSQVLLARSATDAVRDPQLLQFALAFGESIFGDNCATCHGAGGGGAIGYPSLRDDVWLWGGTMDAIEYTLIHGIRSGAPNERANQMPAYGRDGFLKPSEIDDLAHYVRSLSGLEADRQAVARAAPIYQRECVDCHGAEGRGDQTRGAPNLTDAEWLYGGDYAQVRTSIYEARAGVMPNWDKRLDPAAIRAVSIYVHSLGGGE